MGVVKDITGQKFGRLTALYKLHNYHKRATYWLCVCDCGNFTEVRGTNLRYGQTKSCGCLNTEICMKHGKSYTRIHRIWAGVKNRCHNTKNKDYQDYGGRGIAVCDEWRNDFMAFYNWSMANGYDDTLTIDRIDNNKGYEPNNCRWVNQKQQNRNRRSCLKYTINGVTKCLSEWVNIYHINYETARSRLKSDWTIQQALELEGR